MLNQEEPKEYILSSDETHTVKEFVEKAFEHASIPGYWQGEGLSEKFLYEGNFTTSTPLAEVSEEFYRPCEVELLYGNSFPARAELNWEPKISFDKLVQRMVEYDLELEHAKR